MSKTQLNYHKARLSDLKGTRSKYEPRWQEIADYISPERLRLSDAGNNTQKTRVKIIDTTAQFALQTLASGMHSSITSPARHWFRLSTYDDDMKELSAVKTYLAAVEDRMRQIFAASNVYKTFHSSYTDLGLFGNACSLLIEDDERTIRMLPLVHGTFWIARDYNGIATTLYRTLSWSVEKIVDRFGIDKCSHRIQNAYENKKFDQVFTLYHAVEPRKKRDFNKVDKINKPWLSNYWEEGAGDDDAMLEESGFDSNPIIAPAWEIIADDDYGISPAMTALPDVKALQHFQKQYADAVNKKVSPPMTAPINMRNNVASLMPGSITYVDDPTGRGYRPAIDVNISLGELDGKVRETQRMIDRAFYADLFLMLSQMEGVQPRNNLEISERKEEKMLALGPVLENVHNSQLAPTIERTFDIMSKRGMLPEPPRELEGQTIKIEYTSILAQAQKAVSTGSIERLFSFAGNIAAVNPSALDKIDMDQSLDVYADLIGAPPSLIVPDDKVQETRQQRAQQQQQQQQLENAAALAPAANQGAQAAQILSQTDSRSGEQSILQRLGIA